MAAASVMRTSSRLAVRPVGTAGPIALHATGFSCGLHRKARGGRLDARERIAHRGLALLWVRRERLDARDARVAHLLVPLAQHPGDGHHRDPATPRRLRHRERELPVRGLTVDAALAGDDQ